MSDGGESPTGTPQADTPKPGAGWYPDPWTPARRRYWNGTSWTFATAATAQIDDPAPPESSPLAEGHGLPDPVAPRPAGATAAGATDQAAPAKPPQKKWKWAAAVIVGVAIGLLGIAMSTRSSTTTSPTTVPPDSEGARPTTPTTEIAQDPSMRALATLVVKDTDVPATARVVVFQGGIGLDQPTLDICNGRYPSESRRSARIQDAVLDAQGAVVFSTEAVLYDNPGATAQAFSELQAVVAACPPTPVSGGLGQPAVTTRFTAPPDGTWPQTPTVNRQAYDFTTDDGSGETRHTVAVYLQRGRALLGVYFAKPDGPQVPVEGQTTIEGIVGVFAARLAALPVSVVGS